MQNCCFDAKPSSLLQSLHICSVTVNWSEVLCPGPRDWRAPPALKRKCRVCEDDGATRLPACVRATAFFSAVTLYWSSIGRESIYRDIMISKTVFSQRELTKTGIASGKCACEVVMLKQSSLWLQKTRQQTFTWKGPKFMICNSQEVLSKSLCRLGLIEHKITCVWFNLCVFSFIWFEVLMGEGGFNVALYHNTTY